VFTRFSKVICIYLLLWKILNIDSHLRIGPVDAGGGTAFAEQDVAKIVTPTKGSVAFWYDLDKKGKCSIFPLPKI
jgi:hypothetical protein